MNKNHTKMIELIPKNEIPFAIETLQLILQKIDKWIFDCNKYFSHNRSFSFYAQGICELIFHIPDKKGLNYNILKAIQIANGIEFTPNHYYWCASDLNLVECKTIEQWYAPRQKAIAITIRELKDVSLTLRSQKTFLTKQNKWIRKSK